jgi:hypothetical protein
MGRGVLLRLPVAGRRPLPHPSLADCARQAEELARLQRRGAFLEGSLQKERARGASLEEALEAAEAARADAAARCEAYESGVYGLSQVHGQAALRFVIDGVQRLKG